MTIQEKIQKKSDEYGKFAPVFLEGAEFALNNQWINVEDDLPCNHEELIIDDELFDKHTKPVICKKSYGVSCVGIMIYNVDRNAWHWVSERPTHWFPIPELPKE